MMRSAFDESDGVGLTYIVVGMLIVLAIGFVDPDVGDPLWSFFRKVSMRFGC